MNSVQAQQFAAIQKATTTYHNETKTADHMRRREVDMMNREQERQKRVEEELRIAHGSVGEETRKKKNLEVERKRLVQSTEADRQANIKITSELKGVEVSLAMYVCSSLRFTQFDLHTRLKLHVVSL